jgi:CheY-like chemotaxis protein
MGIDLARAHRPNLVILDINLPGMSGYEALRQLKEFPETKVIPVFALSASAMDRDLKRARSAGFTAYLTKPIQVDELLGAVTRVLEGGEGQLR